MLIELESKLETVFSRIFSPLCFYVGSAGGSRGQTEDDEEEEAPQEVIRRPGRTLLTRDMDFAPGPDNPSFSEAGAGTAGQGAESTMHPNHTDSSPEGDSSSGDETDLTYGVAPKWGNANQGKKPNYYERGAKTAYGETRGLYPKQRSEGSIYNPGTWEDESERNLQLARTLIADVSQRNELSKKTSPLTNSIERRAWEECKSAADPKLFTLPKDVNHFFIYQYGVGPKFPNWSTGRKPYLIIGPFNNVGGGDVPKGPNTYVYFYQGVPMGSQGGRRP